MENELRGQLERIEEKLDEIIHHNDWEWNTLGRLEQKLDRICAYVDKIDSEAYRNNEDAKQMVMNIIADVFADGRLKPNNFNNR